MKVIGRKRNLIIYAFVLLIGIFLFSCSKNGDREKASSEKPNIILILADDMGYSDLGCYGGEISTPNIDQIASGGIRFTQFYNAARCCPTRASLLTGLYPHQAGMGGMVKKPGKVPEGPYQGYLSKNSVTIAEVLKQGGYFTAASGKWHVGEERPHWPTDRGFDKYFGLISGAANYFDITKAKSKDAVRHFAIDSTAYMPPKEGFYMTDAITDNAVKFLQIAESKDQPFFLYLPYTAPHWPLHALEEDIEKYKGKYMKGWDVLRAARYIRMLRMELIEISGLLSRRNPEAIAWDELSDEQKTQMDLLMAIYAAQIDRMDQGIGKILEQLEAMQATDNTMIIFLSDNGGSAEYGPLGTDFWGNFWDGEARPGSGDSYHSYGASWANLSNTPFRYYKKDTYEGGIATPFIVKWPNQKYKKGSISHRPGHIIDVMTTICDVAQVEYPETFKGNTITPMPGKSFAPVLNGGKQKDTEKLFWEHNGNRAVRWEGWKLVAKKGESWELYDLLEDRSESENIIEKEPEIAKQLQEDYEAWAKKVGV